MNELLIGTGFVTGILVGLTGVGGGAIMTPMLLFVFGLQPQIAVGTDLLFAAITKITATRIYQWQGTIDWDVVQRLWWGSVPGSILAMLWLNDLPDSGHDTEFLKRAIVGGILLALMSLFLQPVLKSFHEKRELTIVGDNEITRLQELLTIISGALLGIIVTITSVGAGALGMVILSYLYSTRLKPSSLVATDIAHAIPLTLLGGIGHMMLGNMDFAILGTLLIGSIPGVLLGAVLTSFLSQGVLRAILSTTLLALGSNLWWSGLA